MEKEFVPYKESLDLKELGFNEPCFGLYSIMEHDDIEIGDFYYGPSYATKATEGRSILAPTFSQAFRWFRKEHGLYHHIIPEFYKDGINFNWQLFWYLSKDMWTDRVIHGGTMLYGDNGEYSTLEEAELACLRKLIEIVKEHSK